MSKRYNIRWTEADNQELARSIKNYNAKVSRLEKKYTGRSDIVIPEKVSMKEMRDLIGTRRDLQREVKSLQRFTQRGAEELVKVPITENNILMTKWQRTESNRRRATINRMRENRLNMVEDIEMTSGGSSLGYKVGQFGMQPAEKIALEPINAFTKKMDVRAVNKKFRSLKRHSQSDYFNKADQRLIDNYTNSLIETYGEKAVKDVVEEIRKMSFSEFYRKFKSEPGAFEFASDVPDDADLEAYLNHLQSTWLPETRE